MDPQSSPSGLPLFRHPFSGKIKSHFLYANKFSFALKQLRNGNKRLLDNMRKCMYKETPPDAEQILSGAGAGGYICVCVYMYRCPMFGLMEKKKNKTKRLKQ